MKNAARTVLPMILDALTMPNNHWTKVWEHTIRHRSRSRTDDTITSCVSSTNEGLHAAHIVHVARWTMQKNLTPTPLNKGDPVVEDMRRRPAIAGAQPSSCHIALLCKKKGKERPNARLPSARDRLSLISMSWISYRARPCLVSCHGC